MRENLSSSVLTWLRCFDAAARNSSFTKAAAELHLTQGAVSQQVKNLEAWLGLPLFHRTARSLSLTEQGYRLAIAVQHSFQGLHVALAELRQSRREQVTGLSCSPSFALMWLTPRMASLLGKNPDLTLRIQGEFHYLDRIRMEQEQIQAAIRFDPGGYRDLHALAFLDEWLVPVASPRFLADHPQIIQPADLPVSLMLHDAMPWENAPEHVEWDTWLQAVGVSIAEPHSGVQFNLSQLALAAARSGQGVAMGRMALVLEDLRLGHLVQVFPQVVESRASYQFVTQRRRSDNMNRIEHWLLEEGQSFRVERDRWLAQGDALRIAL